MSNAMRFGKRSLAGLAAGALAVTGLAFAAAQPAQAAQTVSVFCSTNNSTGGGTIPDVTTIDPNCTLAAGIGQQASFGRTFVGVQQNDAFLVFTASGDSTFATGTGITLSADAKTAVVATPGSNLANLKLNVPTPGTRTVSITGGPTALFQDQLDRGTLTVTGTGVGTTLLVNQAYYAVDDSTAQTGTAPLALVHVLDANGVPLNLSAATVSGLTTNANGGTITVGTTAGNTLYAANDCDANGYLVAGLDPGATATAKIVTKACDVVTGAGIGAAPNLGMWVEWTAGTAKAGSYTVTFNLTLGTTTYPVTVNYIVSSALAASGTGTLDKAEYAKGAPATFDLCLKDVNGRIVPDGQGWLSVGGANRVLTASVNAVITDPATGDPVAPADLFGLPVKTAATYNGCTSAEFFTPPVDMAAFLFQVKSSSTGGWASTAASAKLVVADTARIGEPEPTKPTIMIVGERGKGDNLNMVFVEGTTTELAGKTVTPYFRFPGQTGFTAGTGTRTVDAQGNFAWQRKTGKQIAVQFRAGDVKSNTTIIEAK